MTHNALGGDVGHVFVGLTDAPATVEPQSERRGRWISGRELFVGGRGPMLEASPLGGQSIVSCSNRSSVGPSNPTSNRRL
jgi:hypothetical protein